MRFVGCAGPNYIHAFQPSDDANMAMAMASGGSATAAALNDPVGLPASLEALFDGSVASHIWLSYNAKASDGVEARLTPIPLWTRCRSSPDTPSATAPVKYR